MSTNSKRPQSPSLTNWPAARPFAPTVICVLTLLSSNLLAEKVGWHPDFVAQVGRGTDLRNQEVLKPHVALLASQPAGLTNGEATINVRFAQHQFDVAKSFALNTSLSVKSLTYSGSVRFGMVDNQTFNGNTLTFVFEGNRNFGNQVYGVTGMEPNFVAEINGMKATLAGEPLHRAITDRFGAHFISGVQKAAKVIMIYTFQFESQSATSASSLDFGLRYKNGVTSAAFSADVSSLLSRSDTKVSMNYQFYTSDPIQLPGFPLTASVTNFQQFLDLGAQVETYLKNLDPARGKEIAYIVEPIQNLPGYLGLIGGYSPENLLATGYERFMQTYAQFRGWDDLLYKWAGDARHMNWLAPSAQQMVLAMRADSAAFVRQLEQLARNHFEKGAPLEVPDAIANYRANLNRIPIPVIGLARVVNHLSSGWVAIGFINCGSQAMTVPFPFSSILEGYPDGRQFGRELYSSAAQFSVFLDALGASGSGPGTAAINDFKSSPTWAAMQSSAQTNRILFFATSFHSDGSDLGRRTFTLMDAANSAVETKTLLDQNVILSFASLEGSTNANLSVVQTSTPTKGVVGQAQAAEFLVTNSGPGAAYGVSVAIPLNPAHEFGSTGGSQGGGVFTNGTLTYHVGSLANGGSASIQLKSIPLSNGTIRPASLVQSSVGIGLHDPGMEASGIVPASVAVSAPSIIASRTNNQVQVRWIAETERLRLEETSTLTDNLGWVPVTNQLPANSSNRVFTVPSAGSGAKYFRLRVQ